MWGAVFALSIVLSGVLFGIGRVAAVGSTAPDDKDYSDGSKVYLEVSDFGATNGLDAPVSSVAIYSKIPDPIVTIYNPNHCTSSIDSADNTGGWDTSFAFNVNGSTIYPTGSNSGLNNFSCTSNTWTTQLSGISSKITIGGTTFYIATLTAAIRGGTEGVNAFQVGTNSGYVSYKTPSKKFALQNRVDSRVQGAYTYGNFNIRFAPNCGVTSAYTADLVSFDDDQMDPAQYNDPGNPSSNPISYDLIEYDSSGNVTNTTHNPLAGYGGGRTSDLPVTIRPNHTYDWRWNNVSSGNGIQFQMPVNTDQIYAVQDCTPPNAPPSGTLEVACGDVSGTNDGTFALIKSVSDPQGTPKYSLNNHSTGYNDGVVLASGTYPGSTVKVNVSSHVGATLYLWVQDVGGSGYKDMTPSGVVVKNCNNEPTISSFTAKCTGSGNSYTYTFNMSFSDADSTPTAHLTTGSATGTTIASGVTNGYKHAVNNSWEGYWPIYLVVPDTGAEGSGSVHKSVGKPACPTTGAINATCSGIVVHGYNPDAAYAGKQVTVTSGGVSKNVDSGDSYKFARSTASDWNSKSYSATANYGARASGTLTDSVGPCAVVSCSANPSNLAGTLVIGTTVSFEVNVKVAGVSTPPPPTQPGFTVVVKGPGGGVQTLNPASPVPYDSYSS
jgi:hypothetical protein